MINFTKHDDLNKITTWQGNHKDVAAYYISLEENMEIAAQRGILSAPTVEVYIEGRLSIQKSGYFSLDEILDKVSSISEQMK